MLASESRQNYRERDARKKINIVFITTTTTTTTIKVHGVDCERRGNDKTMVFIIIIIICVLFAIHIINVVKGSFLSLIYKCLYFLKPKRQNVQNRELFFSLLKFPQNYINISILYIFERIFLSNNKFQAFCHFYRLRRKCHRKEIRYPKPKIILFSHPNAMPFVVYIVVVFFCNKKMCVTVQI